MKDLKELIKDVERDLVINLTLGMRSKRISLHDSELIAKDFIDLFPLTDHDDLFDKLLKLSNKYRIVRKIYVKHAPIYFDEKSEFILCNMRKLIKLKSIDKTINLAKGLDYAKT